MPEPPDFDQIARTIAATACAAYKLESTDAEAAADAAIAEQLRLVWNARGAADTTKIETELSAMMGATASGPYLKNLAREWRKLDR
jgi:hypothetical protein